MSGTLSGDRPFALFELWKGVGELSIRKSVDARSLTLINSDDAAYLGGYDSDN